MGARLVKFDICPKENEQLEVTVKVPEEKRSVVHGIVKDHNDNVVKDAVVKLFELVNPCNPCSAKPLTHTFTDECGQFLFGPLCADTHYLIKIWYDCVKIKPIVIKPDPCDTDCLHHSQINNDSCITE
ncbi:carboxypeptidase regulatory-like domain-containing protein [Clostridium brassicae]|uniref:Carboxypeptidase regulatory-like domain-containing protein n=1 Tax=Clostridium brassicae TaxID=2999072 RepID=A0ABT4D9W3_9CLOT|nr:carboxypeptidase regulatory-like domain-containing protein [Clostridium brassicae]MCY6958958.1 carboxypeptidase regulatory-like domain-containing protein [Clostridium brassicae]